jgi:KDO2-lipid IV(A) lauroyltransferase
MVTRFTDDFMIEFLIRLFARLPLSVAQTFGSLLGRLAWRLNGRERKTVEVNIGLCFPELSGQEREKLAKTSLRENGKLITELPKSWLSGKGYWDSRLEGAVFTEEVRRLRGEGRGVIIAAPHLGNWEIGLNAITAAGPTTVLYRPPRQQWLQAVMDDGRKATGASTAPTTMQGIRALMAALRRGEIVAILPDQVPKEFEQSGVVDAPFFGHPAPTMTLISKLAGKTKAPVLAAYAERRERGRGFDVRFLPVDERVYDPSAEVSATAVNAAVEALVKTAPDQYQWTYRRFGIERYTKQS